MLTTRSWNVIDKSLWSVGGNNNEYIAAMMTKEIADVRCGTEGGRGGNDEAAAALGADGLAIRPAGVAPRGEMLVDVKNGYAYVMERVFG